MITDADRTLAAELGLILVRHPKPESHEQIDEQIIEIWTVKVARTKRPVGRLQLTAANSLYASKFTSGDSSIEETVADALRWIAPMIRHARTGQSDGVETIIRQFGSAFDRPRAITECGAKSTGADYSPIAAQSAIVNGEAGEMCPECKQSLEDKGVRAASDLPDRPGTSTPRQRSFIRHLLDEAACCGRPYLIDESTLDPMSSREASATIDRLKSLKARDWKGDL